MGGPIRLWVRSELRNRWRTLLVLGVIAGLAGGLVVAAVAGARRTATAYDRYRVAVAAPDAIVFGTQVGLFPADYSAVRALPEVEAAGEFTLSPVAIEKPKLSTLAPGDDQLYRTVSRPLLTEGRLPDPARDDEVVVNRAAKKRYGLDVGDRLKIVTSTNIEAFFVGGEMDGPSVDATVVGVGDSMIDQIFLSSGDGEAGFVPSGGLLGRYEEVPRAGNLVVKLRPGTDVSAFRARAQDAVRQSNRQALEDASALDAEIPVRDIGEDRKRYVRGTDLERTALLLFAAAAALAAFVLVGQAIARAAYATADALPAMRALGFTRRASMIGLVLPMSLAAGIAAVVALATAIALSPRFPIGLAAQLDPDPGLHADWWVLVPGVVAVVLAVLCGAALAALRATWMSNAESMPLQPGVVRAIRNVAPLPVGIGAGLALDPGRGPRTVPVRPAIGGAVAGVLGIVGALGLVRGVDDALATPSRAGQNWDVAFPLLDADSPEEAQKAVLEHRDTRAVSVSHRQPLEIAGAGATTVGVVALLLGIPLGIAIGRVSWRWVAESTPLLYVAPIAAAAILIAIPASLFIANALAAWPARRAGRIRPAVVLRTE